MEAEVRPNKLRKLSHGDQTDPEEGFVPGAIASHSNIQSEDKTSRLKDDTEHKTKNIDDSTRQEHLSNENTRILGENATVNSDVIIDKPLSKKQLKKQRKHLEWEAGREFRKVRRKEKTKERKVRRREREEREAEERKKKGQPQPNASRYKPPILLPVTFIIDCEFDDKMAEKEKVSLGSQLTRAYSDNSRAPYQAHLTVSSWGGQLKERFDTLLNEQYKKWRGVRFTDADFVTAAEDAKEMMRGPKGGKMDSVFQKYAQNRNRNNGYKNNPNVQKVPSTISPTQMEDRKTQAPTDPDSVGQPPSTDEPSASDTNANEDKPTPNLTAVPTPLPEPEVIYLTSDSPYTLESLNPHSVYIIGGLVDKNRYKGICYQIAQERGIKTAKLPIGQYMDMQSRSVLATNHVVEIMVRWLECGDWGEAFMKVIPKRKAARLKGTDRNNEGGADEDEESEKIVDGGKGDDLDVIIDQSSIDGNDGEHSDDDDDDVDNDNHSVTIENQS